MPGLGYIGANRFEMIAAVTEFNKAATQLEADYDTLKTAIANMGGIWTDDAHEAYLSLTVQMETDFQNSKSDLLSLSKQVNDFNDNLAAMDQKNATVFTRAKL